MKGRSRVERRESMKKWKKKGKHAEQTCSEKKGWRGKKCIWNDPVG